VCGVGAEQIAAMTFTRKASGEFFNRILNRLSELADGSLNPVVYFQGLTPLPAVWPNFGELLRQTTQAIPKLRLGTLDSFFVSICACFPLELGLPLGASVMPEEEESLAQAQVLQAMMERLFREGDDTEIASLLEAFKEATYGTQEKGALNRLSNWIEGGQTLWLESPECWGRLDLIGPLHSTVKQSLSPLSDLRATVDATVRDAGILNQKSELWWEQLMNQLLLHVPALKLKPRVKELLSKCAAVWPDLQAGSAVLTLDRQKTTFSGPCAEGLVKLVQGLLAAELLVRSMRTQGLAEILKRYEKEYQATVRGAGRLSFSDVQRLLAQVADTWSSEQNAAKLWYRLDNRYQHWLLDEFQDTSYSQWRVMRGLLEEVFQNTEQTRSFFAVGDSKQSIYLWRNAEPKLLDDILAAHPDKDGRGIVLQGLAKSFRSAPEVLSLVNAVFADKAVLKSCLGSAAEPWSFAPHEAVRFGLQGYAAFLWPETAEAQADAVDVTLQLLQEIRPVERGLSCAVIVRGNDRGIEITERIRAETGMEVICESKQKPLTDNAVTLALLSLLKLCAHPGDSFAFEHLLMTPLFQVETITKEVGEAAKLVQQDGFLAFVQFWTERVKTHLGTVDAFTQNRLKQLADLAAEVDSTGNRDVDAFLHQASEYTQRSRGANAAIQVMTVHAAKGLEFDVVILPDISRAAMDDLKVRDLIFQRDTAGELQWVLQPPFIQYNPFDEVLKQEHAHAKERAGFESLCRLYVAMTRAERALYVVADALPGDTSRSMNEARLLRSVLSLPLNREDKSKGRLPAAEGLGQVAVHWAYEQGDQHWYTTLAKQSPAQEQPPQPNTRTLGNRLRELQSTTRRRTPSGEEIFKIKGRVMFSPQRDVGRQLGSLVHELLSYVAWVDEHYDGAAQLRLWAERGLTKHAAYEQALPHALRAIASGAFAKPATARKLWRERTFDMLLPNQDWITGTFDRVVVCDDQALIIDFKTDDLRQPGALEEKRHGYQPQLALYQQAVSRLTGLSLQQIHCQLVFTRLEQNALVNVPMHV
jgi:ATP-dependent exoDNAse (exonuclease V) beta subunit